MLTATPASVTAARRAAELVAGTHWIGGRLRRASRDGVPGRHAGVLEDYGDLAEGLLALHQATAEGRWLDARDRRVRSGRSDVLFLRRPQLITV